MAKVKIKALICMILATLLFGSSFVVTKGATDSIPTYALTASRMYIGSISLAIIFFRRLKDIKKEIVIKGFILSIFYSLGMILQTFGIKYTSAGRSAFLTAAYCIFMPFLEWMILKNKPKGKNLLASLVCFIGIGLVALTESLTIDKGDIFTLLCSICFALYILYNGKFAKDNDIILLNIFLLFFSGIIATVLSIFNESIPNEIGLNSILAILYLAIMCGAFPLVLQTNSQKDLSPTLITIICGFEAVFASVFSLIFLKETATIRCFIGYVLIFSSVFVGVIEKKNKE